MFGFVYRRRLIVFSAALAAAVFLAVKTAPQLLFGAVVSANEGIGYGAVVNALGDASALIEAETAPGTIDRGEGYRYALRRIEMYLNMLTGDGHPGAPAIERCPSKICKFGYDNPDTSYIGVGPLDGARAYRLVAERGTVPYVTYQVFNISGRGFLTGDTLETDVL